MVAVAVKEEYAGKGIAGNLTKLLLENSKKKGFRISHADCTSNFSTRALVKHGGKIENSIDYATLELEGGCCSKSTKPLSEA